MGVVLFVVTIVFGFILPSLWLKLQFDVHADARIIVKPHLLTSEECEEVINIAENTNVWSRTRHAYFPTDDISVRDVPQLQNVSRAVDERIVPLLRTTYGVPPELDIRVGDLFIIRYSKDGQSGLRKHIDDSTLSFSVALSKPSEYVAGGVEFDLLESPVRVHQGSIVMHPSMLYHRGADVQNGTRYVLVGFVRVGDDAVVTAGNAAPGYPARLHGLWARCVVPPPSHLLALENGELLPPARVDAEGREQDVKGANDSSALPSEQDKVCFTATYLLLRQLQLKASAIGEGFLALASGSRPTSDSMQLIYLNFGLLVIYFAYFYRTP
eukprot:6174165-Pleurochrysis_carterae.AAC.2